MHYVYVLYSLKDKKLYTGYASDLEKRIRKHKHGLVDTTKNRRPLKLIYYEACMNKKDALHREIYLKSSWGKKFIKNRIKNHLSNVATVR